MRRLVAGAVIVGMGLVGAMFVAPFAAGAPLTRGFADDVWFDAVGPSWIPRTVATGARNAQLEVDWVTVEPDAPAPGADPLSPSDPQYNFSQLDAAVREFSGTGIALTFLVTDAPAWAEQPGGPPSLEADGAWEPSPTAFGQFATALAARYSGAYPDPQRPGQTLPRVRYFQVWAEANLTVHLAPQWVQHRGRLTAASPVIYRNLLNAFYTGVKSVHPNNVVIASGLAPFGDAAGPCTNHYLGSGCRMPPVQFERALTCLEGQRLRPARCPDPAHFDVVAMDPYEVGAPTEAALGSDDVSVPDLGKLTRVVDRAVRLRLALPATHKQLWVTEFSYDSNPPNPTAVSTATQARWLEESFFLFWREGVSTVFWYLIRDQTGNFSTAYFSGVYFRDGERKPSFEAYRFPLVVMPSGGDATVWGISPRRGLVSIQHQRGRGWQTLFRLRVSPGTVFTGQVSLGLRGNFRAVVDGERSLTWKR